MTCDPYDDRCPHCGELTEPMQECDAAGCVIARAARQMRHRARVAAVGAFLDRFFARLVGYRPTHMDPGWAPRPATPYAEVDRPCGECGCAYAGHEEGRCLGDFLCCPCTGWKPQ